MTNQPFVPAAFKQEGYNCPICNAYAKQRWQRVSDVVTSSADIYLGLYQRLYATRCDHCGGFQVWYQQSMIVPEQSNAPMAHPDMPEEIVEDYNEARSVLAKSPRSSAALLRLCIQKLCVELGEAGKNINSDVSRLVKKGLPQTIQQALDIVRVIGNEQVHPGELDVRDDPSVAAQLFELVNLIVEDRIARPKQIQALYLKLPQAKRDAIEKRDA